MHFRHSFIPVLVLFSVVACGASDEGDQSIAGPPPSEPVVFEASSETKSELGIVKWGFAADEKGRSTYRGYGAKNEVIAEVIQTLDQRDPNHVYFTMTEKDKDGTAVAKVEFYTQKKKDGPDYEVVTLQTENTFEDGKTSTKVLVRFKADSAARTGSTTGGSLTTKARPLEAPAAGGGQLVDPCKELAEKCNVALIDQRIAASGESSECGLLKMVGVPVVTAAATAGAGALFGGPVAPATAIGGAVVGAVIGTGAQSALCYAAQQDASKAQRELIACQNEQANAGCK